MRVVARKRGLVPPDPDARDCVQKTFATQMIKHLEKKFKPDVSKNVTDGVGVMMQANGVLRLKAEGDCEPPLSFPFTCAYVCGCVWMSSVLRAVFWVRSEGDEH